MKINDCPMEVFRVFVQELNGIESIIKNRLSTRLEKYGIKCEDGITDADTKSQMVDEVLTFMSEVRDTLTK